MSYIMIEYLCEVCGDRFESLEDRGAPAASLPHCGKEASRVISAVTGSVKLGSVTQGKNEAPPPNVIDTRPLADGEPLSKWKAKRAKQTRDMRIAEIRRNI